jgi:YesN/AraC family two-component response regulator
MTGMNEDKDVHREMLRKYCMLVQKNSTTGYSPLMQKVINYISQHLNEQDLTLNNTASALSLNKSYLAGIFKKETGETFTYYVNRKRIDHAIFLLNTTNHQIQEIAATCGIPDMTYFTRIFKKQKGMTPTQYRRMIAGKSSENV